MMEGQVESLEQVYVKYVSGTGLCWSRDQQSTTWIAVNGASLVSSAASVSFKSSGDESIYYQLSGTSPMLLPATVTSSSGIGITFSCTPQSQPAQQVSATGWISTGYTKSDGSAIADDYDTEQPSHDPVPTRRSAPEPQRPHHSSRR